MCRIIGISYGPEGPYEERLTPSEILCSMLPAAVTGGPHAYGWMYLLTDGTIHTAKFEGRSDTVRARSTMAIPFEHEINMVWLVGHTRYYTHGSPSVMNNNHPIDHGKIVGVHNGVLRNHDSILKITGRQYEDTEVDSEAIFAAVNKWGHRKGLEKVRGDMVSVYANRERPQTLHIARTKGRSLYFSHTTGGGLMFASEERIVRAASGMADSAMSPLSPNRLVRLKLGRVVERINLNVPTEEWRKFEGADQVDGSMANNYEPLPARELGPRLSRDLRAANNAGMQPAAPQRPRSAQEPVLRPTRPARGYARSSSYKDGDVVGDNKVFYKGLLLTMDEYLLETGGGE